MNIHVPVTSPDTRVSWLNTVYKVLVAESQTEGSLGMFSATVPAASGPPRHIHHREDEIIHVVSGEVEFWLEGETLMRGAGDTVFVPRGKEHAFRVLGKAPAHFLTVLTPGGFEGFFAAAAAAGLNPGQHRAGLDELAARFRCAFTGPPLT